MKWRAKPFRVERGMVSPEGTEAWVRRGCLSFMQQSQPRSVSCTPTGCVRSKPKPWKAARFGAHPLDARVDRLANPLNLDGRVARSTTSENPCCGSAAAVALADKGTEHANQQPLQSHSPPVQCLASKIGLSWSEFTERQQRKTNSRRALATAAAGERGARQDHARCEPR